MVVTACAIIHDSENSASLFNGIVRKLFGYFGGVKIILVFFFFGTGLSIFDPAKSMCDFNATPS